MHGGVDIVQILERTIRNYLASLDISHFIPVGLNSYEIG